MKQGVKILKGRAEQLNQKLNHIFSELEKEAYKKIRNTGTSANIKCFINSSGLLSLKVSSNGNETLYTVEDFFDKK